MNPTVSPETIQMFSNAYELKPQEEIPKEAMNWFFKKIECPFRSKYTEEELDTGALKMSPRILELKSVQRALK